MPIKYGANGLHDGTDETKELAFDVTGVTTGTTRTVTVPNANVDLPEINLTATSNIGLGTGAVDAITTGDYNVGLGDSALTNNTTGYSNTASGTWALNSNTTGTYNTASGYAALYSNTTGYSNTASGYVALYLNTTGTYNTASGHKALYLNTTGYSNTASGYLALYSNTTGTQNVAVGAYAGDAQTSATGNTFIGYDAGSAVTVGGDNTFLGAASGYLMTTGTSNTILGRYNGNQGGLDIRTASNYIVLSDGDGNPRGYCDNNAQWVHTCGTDNFGVMKLVHNTGSYPYGLIVDFNNAAPDDNIRYFILSRDNIADRFKVYSDGDVVNHDNSYGAISDQKLKQQIQDASSQWNDIKALTVRKYKMNSDVEAYGDSPDLFRLGVVAQEVEAAGMTGLIKESPDTEEVDGEIVDLGTTTKSVKYSILYMKAVKALQEAMERIETLEAKVTALETI